MSTWKKKNERIIDQRAEVLPPAWCPRAGDGGVAPVRVGGVWRSDPSRETANAIVSALDLAREVVVVMTFLLADAAIEEALLRAAKRGARVYLLLSTEARLDKELREDSGLEQALAQHKAMLKKLAGWVLLRSAEGFHAKVVLVDPARGGPGFLLTSNLTSGALTQNEELAIELTAVERAAMFRHLAWAMWEGAEREMLEPGKLIPLGAPPARVQRPDATGSVVATPNQPGTLRAAVLAMIQRAERSLVVASFGWQLGHEVLAALEEKARAGVSVTTLARLRRAAMPALLALAKAGVHVLGYPSLHAKAVLVDGREALVMTANLESHGLDDSMELGVLLDAERSAGIATILRSWTENAPFELRLAPELGEVRGEAQVWVESRLIPYRVVGSESRALASAVARSADRLESEPVVPRGQQGLPLPAHQIAVTWDVTAPMLGAGATKLETKLPDGGREGDPPVFRERDGRTVVAVRGTDQLPRALEIANHVKAAAIVVQAREA